MENFVKCFIVGLVLSLNITFIYSQYNSVDKHVNALSKNKWQWMADKNVVALDSVFHEESVYVHMGGSWDKSTEMDVQTSITKEHDALIRISSQAAVGDLAKLRDELHSGLDVGLTINQLKEGLIHLNAYTGFPRSIRGLQTLMAVVEERQKNGIKDQEGRIASPISTDKSKYERGKTVLQQLTGVKENDVKTGYAAFAPTIEVFLKEHLFADLFERDVLTYLERELVTISVLASIGRVEPMLKSHLTICVNLGCTPTYLQQFVQIIKETQGEERGAEATKVLGGVFHKIEQ